MFYGQAEAAMKFYTGIFPDSKIIQITRSEAGTVMQATFTLNGQEYMCIDSPPVHAFTFTPAISLFVTCDTAEETDNFFNRLSEGGKILMPLGTYPFSKMFGWLSDRYGVSWQLTVK